MAKVRFTKKAVEDLSDIWNYTADNWSELQADRYYEMFIMASKEMAESSTRLGRRYEEIMSGLYGFHAGKHIIFYRHMEDQDEIEVIRILHERMDLKTRIEE